MTLPFLKKKEGAASSPIESVERKPDEGKESEYGMLDAIAEDLHQATTVEHTKAALQAFMEHIMSMDKKQDEEEMKHE